MEFLKHLPICDQIPDQLKNDIKSYHLFVNETDGQKESLLFVTNDDKVYGLGDNYWLKLGLPEDQTIEWPQEVKELNGKGVKEFFVGDTYVLALTSDGKLYSWGNNNYDQLGRPCGHEGYDNKPALIDFIDGIDFKIKQIYCQSCYVMVMLENNIVFVWGREFIEYNKSFKEFNCPEELIEINQTNQQAIYIDFNEWRFFAINSHNKVLSWGRNEQTYLGHQCSKKRIKWPTVVSKLANLKIIDVKCSDIEVYFLSNEGKIFVCCNLEEDGHLAPKYPTLIGSDQKFIQLERIDNKTIVCKNEKQIVYELRRKKVIETEFTSFEEYSIGKRGITYKTFSSGLTPQTKTAEKVLTKEMNALSVTSSEDELICKICFVRKVQSVVNPCGHALCNSCTERLTNGCYICRSPVTSVINLHL